jgi:hypothetical protein
LLLRGCTVSSAWQQQEIRGELGSIVNAYPHALSELTQRALVVWGVRAMGAEKMGRIGAYRKDINRQAALTLGLLEKKQHDQQLHIQNQIRECRLGRAQRSIWKVVYIQG